MIPVRFANDDMTKSVPIGSPSLTSLLAPRDGISTVELQCIAPRLLAPVTRSRPRGPSCRLIADARRLPHASTGGFG